MFYCHVDRLEYRFRVYIRFIKFVSHVYAIQIFQGCYLLHWTESGVILHYILCKNAIDQLSF